jgi:hypothetical protein
MIDGAARLKVLPAIEALVFEPRADAIDIRSSVRSFSVAPSLFPPRQSRLAQIGPLPMVTLCPFGHANFAGATAASIAGRRRVRAEVRDRVRLASRRRPSLTSP